MPITTRIECDGCSASSTGCGGTDPPGRWIVRKTQDVLRTTGDRIEQSGVTQERVYCCSCALTLPLDPPLAPALVTLLESLRER